MNDPKKITDYFNKAKAVIESCTTEEHIQVAKNTVEVLLALGIGERIPYDYYIIYVNHLKQILKEKIKSLGL